MDLSQWIEQPREAHAGTRAALRFEGEEIGYAALARADRRDRRRRWRAAASAPGDRVAWLGLNSPAMLADAVRLRAARRDLHAAELAPRAAGAPGVAARVHAGAAVASTRSSSRPAPQRASRPPARAASRSAASPRGWTAWDEFIARRGAATLADPAPIDARAPLLLCYTSGSTGRPKGALLSQEALECECRQQRGHAWARRRRPRADDPAAVPCRRAEHPDRCRRCSAGCTVTLHPKFDADATLDAIEQERITLTVLVPAQLEAHAGASALGRVPTCRACA